MPIKARTKLKMRTKHVLAYGRQHGSIKSRKKICNQVYHQQTKKIEILKIKLQEKLINVIKRIYK